MIIAHLADLHLGYRAYHRLAPGGINARESDVAKALSTALDRIIGLDPAVVLVAGDVFHTVRPSNRAIAEAFRQFARLRAALPNAPVVIIAGKHDSPRAAETGSILRLMAEISGIVVVDDAARAVYLEALDTSVLCVPHGELAHREETILTPDPTAATNILVLYRNVVGGPAEGKIRDSGALGGPQVECSEIQPERWDYIALGHYHIATEITPNMWYCGGIERTSANIWEEAASAKGFLTFDTESGKATFHPLPGREVVDLPRFSGRAAEEPLGAQAGEREHAESPQAQAQAETPEQGKSLEPGEIDARIRSLVESVDGGIEGKIVRLVIEDVPREVYRELDHGRIREYRAEALHFHLDARRPESPRVDGPGDPDRRRTLEEEVEDFLERKWQPSSKEIDVERLLAMARFYLAAQGATEAETVLAEARADE